MKIKTPITKKSTKDNLGMTVRKTQAASSKRVVAHVGARNKRNQARRDAK